MVGVIERRTNEIVHACIANEKRFVSLFHVENFGYEYAGVPGDASAWIKHQLKMIESYRFYESPNIRGRVRCRFIGITNAQPTAHIQMLEFDSRSFNFRNKPHCDLSCIRKGR
jgi:hypothetical protein